MLKVWLPWEENMSNITLEEWNAEITQSLIPDIVILSLWLIIGLFGNLIVIVV